MINAAVLGFGTVGSGTVEIINGKDFSVKTGEDIKVTKILDLRTFEDSPYGHLVTSDFETIINDNDISIVVETMGGTNPAYDFTKRCLLAGKSVVTSNKELVATHGTELLQIAKDKNVSYMFEASVGGGIPIIRPLCNCLAANDINQIMGILNGTTNYILTKMIKDGDTLENALLDAQKKGYAERNPKADIEGIDACRKIAILASLAFGKFIDSTKISTEGITNISLEDVKYADKIGCSIKLIGQCKNVNGKVFAKVSPLMLPKDNALSDVEGVFNAILVNGSATGDVMFYGKGAGKMPTASAVAADVIDIVMHRGLGTPYWEDGGELTYENPDNIKLYIRLTSDAENIAKKLFENITEIKSDEGEFVFITDEGREKELLSKVKMIKNELGDSVVKNTIQVVF
ncbi:MAG: homoserine dehydrogenase [Clostridia bacterium]|nr:homoserine dehydrogenase [Clostridia bacterium]